MSFYVRKQEIFKFFINERYSSCRWIGTRLHPVTKSISKQLLPVYDKPMVYYPLISFNVSRHQSGFANKYPVPIYQFTKDSFGDGSQFGIQIQYAEQKLP